MSSFQNLTDSNYLIYAMRGYENPHCVDVLEFDEDLKKIKYLKKLFSLYRKDGELKERLILNHLITFFNVFEFEHAIRILFLRVEEDHYSLLKSFLVYLNKMPDKIYGINGKTIYREEIVIEENILQTLRKL